MSAAAAADHHWYVLTSGRRSGDKRINVDAPQSQFNPTARYVGLYRCVKNDDPEGPAVKGFKDPKLSKPFILRKIKVMHSPDGLDLIQTYGR